MTPAQLDALQNRLDRGVTSSVDAHDLMQEVRRLHFDAALDTLREEAAEARDLRERVRELEAQVQKQDGVLNDLAGQSLHTSSALDGWEDKIDHMRSSYETALLLRDEEIARLKARLA